LVARRAQRLDDVVYRLASNYQKRLRELRRRLDAAAGRVQHFDFRRSLMINRSRLDSTCLALARAIASGVARRYASLNQIAGKLEALSPMKILDRGYALVFDFEGALVKDSEGLVRGDRVSVRLAKGGFKAEIIE
jgi:exodeoxyribonuclease VII large subunit